jgi:hypothetical protein
MRGPRTQSLEPLRPAFTLASAAKLHSSVNRRCWLTAFARMCVCACFAQRSKQPEKGACSCEHCCWASLS